LSLDPDYRNVPADDILPGAFIAFRTDTLGKEWITTENGYGRPTKYIGASQHSRYRGWYMLKASYAIIGTHLCGSVLEELRDTDNAPLHDAKVFSPGDTEEQVVDYATTPYDGEWLDRYGEQYEKCLNLTVTLEDGSPLPDFIKYDPVTRTLSYNPLEADAGKYVLHFTYGYQTLDPQPPSPTPAFFTSMDVEVLAPPPPPPVDPPVDAGPDPVDPPPDPDVVAK